VFLELAADLAARGSDGNRLGAKTGENPRGVDTAPTCRYGGGLDVGPVLKNQPINSNDPV
jgi:hypothetical protein